MKIEYINIWRKSGLLENLTLSQANKCAESLTKISRILLNESIEPILNKTDKMFGKGYVVETLIPVVRRLYNYNLENFPNENWLFKDYIKFLNKQKNKLKSQDAVNLYCENLIKKLKKDNIKKEKSK